MERIKLNPAIDYKSETLRESDDVSPINSEEIKACNTGGAILEVDLQ